MRPSTRVSRDIAKLRSNLAAKFANRLLEFESREDAQKGSQEHKKFTVLFLIADPDATSSFSNDGSIITWRRHFCRSI